MRNLLAQPAFARLWVAAFFGESADWMLKIALPLYLFQATGSAGATALAVAISVAPAVLVSPVAGVLADRCDRRLVLCAVCGGFAVVAIPLAGHPSVAVVYAVLAAQEALNAVFEPTRNALVPELVGVPDVTAANGLISVNASLARLAGGWLGGAVLGWGGLARVVEVYLAALAVATALLMRRFGGRQSRAAVREPVAWLGGVRELAASRLRPIGVALIGTSLAQGMFLALFAVYVLGVLRGSEADAGLLRGVQAIGGLAAGFGLAALGRRAAPARVLSWGAVTLGVVSAVLWNLPAFTTGLGVYIGLFMLAGAPAVLVGAGLLGELQSAVPPERAGRVLSSAYAVMALGGAAGALGVSLLVDATGPVPLLDVQAALYLGAGLVVTMTGKRRGKPRIGRRAGAAVVTVEQCPTSSPPVTST